MSWYYHTQAWFSVDLNLISNFFFFYSLHIFLFPCIRSTFKFLISNFFFWTSISSLHTMTCLIWDLCSIPREDSVPYILRSQSWYGFWFNVESILGPGLEVQLCQVLVMVWSCLWSQEDSIKNSAVCPWKLKNSSLTSCFQLIAANFLNPSFIHYSIIMFQFLYWTMYTVFMYSNLLCQTQYELVLLSVP